jgi:hypothetical protein
VELGADYRGMLQQPVGNERVIDTVGLRGGNSFVCRDPSHAFTSTQIMGATYPVREDAGPQRHRHEPILEQLRAEAKRHYPTENIDIRSAKTARHIPTNAREEQYQQTVNQNGRYVTVNRTRPIWDCFLYYTVDVVTTDPMPAPVTHSEDFTKPGATRNDIYRWAINWIEDNLQNKRIKVQSEDIDRGRIRGTVTCAARADQTYIVTSSFTIDVYDAKVEIRFVDTVLQRTDPELKEARPPEPIFLQSIADSAKAEMVDFSTTLRSVIVSR